MGYNIQNIIDKYNQNFYHLSASISIILTLMSEVFEETYILYLLWRIQQDLEHHC